MRSIYDFYFFRLNNGSVVKHRKKCRKYKLKSKRQSDTYVAYDKRLRFYYYRILMDNIRNTFLMYEKIYMKDIF